MALRTITLATLFASLFGLAGIGVNAQDKKQKPEDQAKVKKALQEVQDFIGLWNLEGTQKTSTKTEAWKEKVSWGWKFKDGDAWITVSFGDEGKGKYFTTGELKYNLEKKKYQLNLTGTDKTEQAFEGDTLRSGGLKMERKDAKTGDVYRLTLNTLADGVRFQMKFEKQDGGKGLFSSVFAMNGNKDGESIAGGSKKQECIVSGGAASIAVSYKGKTYFVCCTGCRDEFNANPEKYVKGK
jgi:YHS domain-containing protein